MKNHNPLIEKSYAFSIRIVKTYQLMVQEKKEFVLSRQILKSGTSIGANSEEAQGAQSKRDFIAKVFIAYKEAKETHYWLRLFRDTDLLDKKLTISLLNDCNELIRIIVAVLKSSKQ